MVPDLKSYPAYKDSRVRWLGEVPAHWDLRKLKYAVSFSGGGTPSKADASFWNGHIPWLSPKDMRGSWISDTADHISDDAVRASATSIVPPGALLMVVRSGILRRTIPVAINTVEVALNQDMKALRPRPVLTSEYLRAVVQGNEAKLIAIWTKQGATVESIEHEFLANSLVPIPPLPEQSAIVRFLDHADRRIRRYIHAKKKLVALLNEQKEAIINRAVTRGLNPTVLLKPSGVEWLGNVPEHWDVLRVKQLSQVLRGKFTHRPRNDPSLYDGPYPFIQTGEVARATKRIRTYRQTLNERGLAVSKMFPAGTLVMTIAANIGDVAVLDFEACFPDSIVGFVPRAGVDRDYLFYVFLAMKPELLREAPVNTQGNLNIDRIGSRGVPVPPVLEQQEIVRHVEQSTADLNSTLERAQRQIDLLREYRTRLIADVVSGKLDVREAAAKLPDEAEEPELLEEADAVTDTDEDDADDLDAAPAEAEA